MLMRGAGYSSVISMEIKTWMLHVMALHLDLPKRPLDVAYTLALSSDANPCRPAFKSACTESSSVMRCHVTFFELTPWGRKIYIWGKENIMKTAVPSFEVNESTKSFLSKIKPSTSSSSTTWTRNQRPLRNQQLSSRLSRAKRATVLSIWGRISAGGSSLSCGSFTL
jgi:hypothetical protein